MRGRLRTQDNCQDTTITRYKKRRERERGEREGEGREREGRERGRRRGERELYYNNYTKITL